MLSVENLMVRYRNGAIGVHDVSLAVEAGQVVVIFGPNGAGKTTTVRAITGFAKAEGAQVIRGSVRMFGHETTNLEPVSTTALGLSFVPERRKIFPNLTVAENLAAVRKRPPRGRRAELEDRVYGLFPVLAKKDHEPAGRLSGGQQQMLAIGRCVMSESKLLVIDELTLGLHVSLHSPLYQVVRAISSEGRGVIVVDESAGSALAVADQCYLLNAGRVRMSGPPEQFAGNELLAAGYVESEGGDGSAEAMGDPLDGQSSGLAGMEGSGNHRQ